MTSGFQSIVAKGGEPAAQRQLTRREERKLRAAQTRFADFLPDVQALAEREHSPVARLLIFTLVLIVAGGIAFISLAEVTQVASATGIVRPEGRVKLVNHPQGGRVAKLHVREGERVSLGQALVEFDPVIAGEEAAKVRADLESASAEVARLEAEAEGRQASFPATLIGERPDLVAGQVSLLQARRQAQAARLAAADEVTRQREQEMRTLEARARQQAKSLGILEEQIAAISKLADKGYFPKLRFLSVQRELTDLQGELAETESRFEVARAALAEAQQKREGVEREWQAQLLAELGAARARRDEAGRTLEQHRNLVENLVLRAPTDGVVQGLEISGPGQAVGANQPLMRIVPTEENLVVVARVANDDIGFIERGQRAIVKVVTYDFIKYGTLEGVVERISSDSSTDERTGALYFDVEVRTQSSHLGEDERGLPVTPGMATQVDLVIGERTIFAFLTDRLRQSAAQAFRER